MVNTRLTLKGNTQSFSGSVPPHIHDACMSTNRHSCGIRLWRPVVSEITSGPCDIGLK